MKKVIATTFCALLMAISYQAVAEKPFEDEIEARKAFMQLLKFNISILGDMAKGNREYDAQLAENLAKNLHTASLMDNAAMWPKGSDNGNKVIADITKALPELWSDYPTAVEKHQDWTKASAAMAANAGKGLDSLRQSIGPVGKSCKSCHKGFKAKD